MQCTHTKLNSPASIVHDVLIMSAYETLQEQFQARLACMDASTYSGCSASFSQAWAYNAVSLDRLTACAWQACAAVTVVSFAH